MVGHQTLCLVEAIGRKSLVFAGIRGPTPFPPAAIFATQQRVSHSSTYGGSPADAAYSRYDSVLAEYCAGQPDEKPCASTTRSRYRSARCHCSELFNGKSPERRNVLCRGNSGCSHDLPVGGLDFSCRHLAIRAPENFVRARRGFWSLCSCCFDWRPYPI